jgi:hypothetical protein
MLSLKSFHLFFITVAIILTAGLGAWGVLTDYRGLGSLCLALSVLLILYEAYFAAKAKRMHLE